MADGAAKGRSSKEERTGDRNILFLHLYLFQSVRNFCFPTLCQWFPPRGNFSITEHHTMLQNVSSFLLVPAILEILLPPISSNCRPLSSRPFQFQVPAPISLRVSQKIPRSGSTKRVFSCVVCLTSNLPLMSHTCYSRDNPYAQTSANIFVVPCYVSQLLNSVSNSLVLSHKSVPYVAQNLG